MRSGARALAAAALVGVLLPWGVGSPALADETTAEPQEVATPAFGYSATAWSTPVHVEVYEPSLPIPATPQLEFMMAYSKVKSDGGTTAGRASWFWPGDPVGEGLKTFAEQLGLPAQLFEEGYPVQVNAQHPSDEESVADEPFPGMVMRASAGEHEATGSTGFTPDSSVEDADASSGKPLADLLGVLGGKQKQQAASVPGMPAGLGALVDFNGYVSTSSSAVEDGVVRVTSRSTLGDISLLGGLVTLSGVKAVATTTSDGGKPAARSKNTWGELSVLGQEFTIGPEGIEAAGKKQGIPGLSNSPAKALEQLGITITVPDQVREVEGRRATVESRGLQIEIKTDLLKPVLSALPLDKLADLVPDQAGPLKSVLAGLGGMAPRIVVTLGESRSTLETVPPMDPVDDPIDEEETPAPTDETPTDDAAPTSSDAAPSDAAPDDPGAPASDVPPGTDATGDLPPSQAVSAGLPKLFSIPAMFTLGGIALAAAVGSWFRRAGLLALGAGGACTHGLDTGLPDLRKV